MKNQPLPAQAFTLQDAVLIAAVPQVVFFLGGAFLAIFGVGYVWGIATIASCLWWMVMMWIGFARQGPPTASVVRTVKWSYFPLLVVASIAWPQAMLLFA